MNRHQLEVIEYLRQENRVLREQRGGRRLRLTDDQRRRLAARGHQLGRRVLTEVATIVTPDTILRWHRRLIARQWTSERRRVGRPGVLHEIRRLTVKMAREHPSGGYRRLQGARETLEHRGARPTISKILKDHGIGPVPGRPMSWRTFLAAHWGNIAAADFFTTEVWTRRGPVTYYTLFIINVGSRNIHLAGSTPQPDEAFMLQAARNPDGCERRDAPGPSGPDLRPRHDAEPPISAGLLADAGIRVVQTPYRSPNGHAHAERFVRSIKEECLDRVVLFGEARFRRTLGQSLDHYHRERTHQGIENRLIAPGPPGPPGAEICCRKRLGGLLCYDHRAA